MAPPEESQSVPMEFKDPFNPTEAELRQWAYLDEEAAEDVELEQDFDLYVGENAAFQDLIIELAGDDKCTQQKFFLSCAYLIVGNPARQKFADDDAKAKVLEFLLKVKAKDSEKLNLLHSRAEALLAAPETFEYDKWCSGGLAYE
eukprot:TRINITY_DN67525_c5_g12_i1.p1 TRINITY_DN67525_c5_g12~~TRINITY_DN67525_c5_g12_i1.p1  ORF type:complete len:162 (-),score=33.35 TRINITY_DN67525_c5_g12_i1:584-1018(-)